MKLIKELRRYEEIDFIKAMAIIFVIVLHCLVGYRAGGIRLSYLYPFHIWHAVPMFMILAGINSSLSMLKGKYSVLKNLKNILIPYSVLWIINLVFYQIDCSLYGIIKSYFCGVGYGGYFIPLFWQHIIMFPLTWKIIEKLEKKYSPLQTLTIFFIGNIIILAICQLMINDIAIYARLYFRHIFSIYLGIHFVKHGFTKKFLLGTSFLSVLYIVFMEYTTHPSTFLYLIRNCDMQHPPVYFYTMFFIVLLWKLYPHIRPIAKNMLIIGQASFSIYLFQCFYFMRWRQETQYRFVLNLVICILVGVLFYKYQSKKMLKKF